MTKFTRFLKSYDSDTTRYRWYEDRDVLYKLFHLKGFSVWSIDDMLVAHSMGERYKSSEHIEIRLFGHELVEVASLHIADIMIHNNNKKVCDKAKAHHKVTRG